MKHLTTVVVLAILSAFCLGAQTASQDNSFVAAGWAASGLKTGNVWGSYGKDVGAGFFSLTTVDVTPLDTKQFRFQTSVRTGVAYLLKQVGSFSLIGLGDLGAATTSTAVGSAFSGGGCGAYDTGVRWRHLNIVTCARLLKTTNDKTVVLEIGIAHRTSLP